MIQPRLDRPTVAGRVPADPQTEDAVRFTLNVGRALHTWGLPAHRLEETLVRVAARAGLENAQFFSTPTSLFASFDIDGVGRTHLLRIDPGNINLEKLVRLFHLVDDASSGRVSIADADEKLRAIHEAPPRYRRTARTVAFAGASAGAAVFFGAGWREVVAAGAIGLILGVLALLIERRPQSARLYEFAAGFVAALVAILAGRWLGPVNASTAAVCGVILLVPGLSFTLAMSELATRHYIAGASRLVGAIMVLLALGFGVGLGSQLDWLAPADALHATMTSVSAHWTVEIALVVAMGLALTVLFQARAADAPAIIVASILGLYGARLGAAWLGPELGACAGAFVVGVTGNLHARLRGLPAALTTLPGIILLVPGSIGFRSVASLLDHDVLVGVEAAFLMAMVGVSIVAGLLLANVAAPTPRAL